LIHELRVRQIARQEIISAARYYGRKSPTLGLQFFDRIDNLFALIKEHPLLFPLSFPQFRRALLKQFPYVIFYEIENDMILVGAVLHQHQDTSVISDR